MEIVLQNQIIEVMKLTFVLAMLVIGYAKYLIPLKEKKLDKVINSILAFLTICLLGFTVWVGFAYIKLLWIALF